ncbi:uncharacterized protein TrAFT101_006535 [Trichoderma asperellum]|uniref:uncharacterized protein n=1 Tax=Trichoderma asperellum TaxID=101201 RepID=UPI00332B4DB2|nr:hypothetical protein TrAFT101_006535 [Trichoderma asperellum]
MHFLHCFAVSSRPVTKTRAASVARAFGHSCVYGAPDAALWMIGDSVQASHVVPPFCICRACSQLSLPIGGADLASINATYTSSHNATLRIRGNRAVTGVRFANDQPTQAACVQTPVATLARLTQFLLVAPAIKPQEGRVDVVEPIIHPARASGSFIVQQFQAYPLK